MSAPNPYLPPQAVVAEAPRKPGSPVTAVVVGLVVDFGATVLAVVIFVLIYVVATALSGAASGADVEPLMQEATAKLTAGDSWPFYAAAVIGTLCSVLAGYVCARIARQRELTLGALLGAIITIVSVILGPGDTAIGVWRAVLLANMAAVLAGAWLGLTTNRSLGVRS